MNELSSKLNVDINRCDDLANKICQIERDTTTIYVAFEHMQMINLEFEIFEKRLSKIEIHLENLNLFLNQLKDIVNKIIKATTSHLNLKSFIISNLVCKNSKIKVRKAIEFMNNCKNTLI